MLHNPVFHPVSAHTNAHYPDSTRHTLLHSCGTCLRRSKVHLPESGQNIHQRYLPALLPSHSSPVHGESPYALRSLPGSWLLQDVSHYIPESPVPAWKLQSAWSCHQEPRTDPIPSLLALLPDKQPVPWHLAPEYNKRLLHARDACPAGPVHCNKSRSLPREPFSL